MGTKKTFLRIWDMSKLVGKRKGARASKGKAEGGAGKKREVWREGAKR